MIGLRVILSESKNFPPVRLNVVSCSAEGGLMGPTLIDHPMPQ